MGAFLVGAVLGLSAPGFAQPGIITTVAGTGVSGYSSDGTSATAATFTEPSNVCLDGAGNLYIVETTAHRVRKVDAATGLISTVAGTGAPVYNGDGIPATSANLWQPRGVAVDGAGNIYIADGINHRVRKVDATTGLISTVAGTGTIFDDNANGIPAVSATVFGPQGLAVDGAGNLYIAGGYFIRKVSAATGLISIVAGLGATMWGYNGDGIPATSAKVMTPVSVAVDGAGNIYFADHDGQRIRRVDAVTGLISTIAGLGITEAGYNGDGIPATSARIYGPTGIAVDGAGNVYFGDTGNNRVRKVDAATGLISTVAGTGVVGYNGDGIAATSALLNAPSDLCLDGNGNIFLADALNYRVRKVEAASASCQPVVGWSRVEPGIPGPWFQPVQDVVVDRDGNVIAVGHNYDSTVSSSVWRVNKYDSSGHLLWSRTEVSMQDVAHRVDVGPDGAIVVAGFCTPPLSSLHAIARKYAPDGTLLWTVTAPGVNRVAVAVDCDGNSILASQTWGGPTTPKAWTLRIDPAGHAGPLVLGMTSGMIEHMTIMEDGGYAIAGWINTPANTWWVERRDRNSSLVWSRTLDAGLPGGNKATAVDVASGNHIIVLGVEEGATVYAVKLRRYDGLGNVVWDRVLRTQPKTSNCYPFSGGPTTSGADMPWGSVAVDACNKIFVTGLPGTVVTDAFDCHSYGYYAERYDGDGNLEWRWDHPDSLRLLSTVVALSPDGGFVLGGAGFTDPTVPPGAPIDWILYKLDQPGCACAGGIRMCPPPPPQPPEPVDQGKVKIVGGVRGYLDPKRGEQATILVRPATAGDIRDRIYTMEGVPVKDMVRTTTGGHTEVLTWDATDAAGRSVPSGVYPVFIEAPGIRYRDKLVVVR